MPGSRLLRVIGLTISFTLTVGLTYSLSAQPANMSPSSQELEVAASIIADKHVDRPARNLIPTGDEEAFRQFLLNLDPFTRLLAPDDNSYGGRPADGGVMHELGFGFVAFDRAQHLLAVPLVNGPMWEAGVRDAILVTEVDSISTLPRTREQSWERLRKAEDSVQLAFDHVGSGKRHIETLRIARQPLNFQSVELVSGQNLSLIRFHRFETGVTTSQFLLALARLESNLSDQPLVLDLRFATGGDVLEAAKIADLFLPQGVPVLALRDALGEQQWLTATSDTRGGLLPSNTLLLVGPETASASESFVKALHAAGAIVVGAKTAGKCVGQEVFSIGRGWRIVVTSQYVLGPNGEYCAGNGIEPTRVSESVEKNDHLIEVTRLGQSFFDDWEAFRVAEADDSVASPPASVGSSDSGSVEGRPEQSVATTRNRSWRDVLNESSITHDFMEDQFASRRVEEISQSEGGADDWSISALPHSPVVEDYDLTLEEESFVSEYQPMSDSSIITPRFYKERLNFFYCARLGPDEQAGRVAAELEIIHYQRTRRYWEIGELFCVGPFDDYQRAEEERLEIIRSGMDRFILKRFTFSQ